jgi:flagellar motility protein MotE (MotC chaperone)
MTQILQSKWIAVAIGVIVYVLTTVLLWHPAAPVVPEAPAAPSLVPSWEYRNPEVDQMILDLKKEKDSLAEREKQLNELALRLQAERLELNTVTQMVDRLQKEFDRNVVRVREEETVNLKKLAKVYSGMSPEGATTILKEMPDDQVVKILIFMKENETGPILEAMAKGSTNDTKRAALISDRLRLSSSRDATAKAKSP